MVRPQDPQGDKVRLLVPLRKPISPVPDGEDDREPIDEPYLPEDPGDEP